MLMNYRYYTTQAMIELLTRERVYYSRGNMNNRGRFSTPDTVSLRVSEAGTAMVIECEIYNAVEGIEAILQEKGFVRDEAAGRRVKQWTIAIHHKLDAGKLVSAVVAGLNEAERQMPLMLYASGVQKALADYYGFMTSDIPKISYDDVMQYLGYWEGYDPGGAAAADDTARDYLVARYKKGRWAAWASGDLIVPLFATESEARQFLKNRVTRLCRHSPAIRTVAPLNKGCQPSPYVLVDHAKPVKERLAWLRSEIGRLERQNEVVC